MSETQQTLFNKRACFLCIAGKGRHRTVFTLCCASLAFFLLLTLFFAFLTPPLIETQSVKVIEPPAEPHRKADALRACLNGVGFSRLAHPPVFDSETYYRTIIDNNLFRPLGWSPPPPIEPYRLIGTKLARDPNTPHKQLCKPSPQT